MSLAARIEATDGKLFSALEAELVVPDVEVAAGGVVDVDVLDCDAPSVPGLPGVPKSVAAWPRTASAFARPADGLRNEA